MKLTALRLTGFKSFVDPVEIAIEPGLTGIVGPNGCGKSNLVEALRWVMGESSFKAMRAAEMDEVIFSGSGARPARNHAEVAVVADNADRRAPAAFNEGETIEIVRRIEREAGSAYRVNGREVRARDVQLIFADASTGARSPALVRQGQIGELIGARPQARRLLLEEAAGISGLHARRQEAESRLTSAEQNLARLDDLLGALRAQLEGLRRQARQAGRYRALSAEIRRLEAALLIERHREGEELRRAAERALAKDRAAAEHRTALAAEAARTRALAAADLPALREAARAAGEALARAAAARTVLDHEGRRAAERLAELDGRLAQLETDLARECGLLAEAEDARGKAELAAAEPGGNGPSLQEARRRRAEAEAAFAEAQDRHQRRLALLATEEAARRALERNLQTARDRLARETREAASLAEERRRLERARAALPDAEAAALALAEARQALSSAESAAVESERALTAGQERERAARDLAGAAERECDRLVTEIGTLRKLLDPAAAGTPLLARVRVAPGHETALGAALGEDLASSEEPEAPAYWRHVEPQGDPALPDGITPLAAFVEAPPVLARRLAQTGVVAAGHGAALQPRLAPGQRLVSLAGDVWRWDGFTVAGGAETAAARRLAARNRLAELDGQAEAARERLRDAQDAARTCQDLVGRAAAACEAHRQALRRAREQAAAGGDASARAQAAATAVEARLLALAQSESRAARALNEASSALADAQAALAGPAPDGSLSAALAEDRLLVEAARRDLLEAGAEAERLAREAAMREVRREAAARDAAAWAKRAESAAAQARTLETRRAELAQEREGLEAAPARLREQGQILREQAETAERERARAADALARAETGLRGADAASAAAERALAAAREALARSEPRLEAACERLAELDRRIEEAFACTAADLAGRVGLDPGAALGAPAEIDARVARLKADRERLGAVNLRAEEEAQALEERHGGLDGERRDLAVAIGKLRGAVQSLNQEGRERMLAALTAVNTHFQGLFATLFGGGSAELRLAESDDPLGAGLDILARPPGKAMQTLTLLSGGEQALTALALIFAVFLASPAPICVLDEVDAPLDDANVDRFCTLLHEMRRRTDTRFLVITHNPITMSRMDRLYGVTMVERGVSRIVSVELEEAERLAEAV